MCARDLAPDCALLITSASAASAAFLQGHWVPVQAELLLVLLPLLCICHCDPGCPAGLAHRAVAGPLGVGLPNHLLPGVSQRGGGGVPVFHHLQLHLPAVLSGE